MTTLAAETIAPVARSLALAAGALLALSIPAHAQQKPNILVIFGDDVGQTNISASGQGVVGYKTPNIDPIAKEGMMFADYYVLQRRRRTPR